MSDISLQSNDYHWFLDNYDKLYSKYGHKYLAIKNNKVIGAYDSYADAVNETLLKEELGSFIVQECNGDESAYMAQIASLNFIGA